MNKILAVDFDGTVVRHEYPEVGPDVPHAQKVLRQLVANDVKLILWTMRSGMYLVDAVDWFRDRDIPLYGINSNPEQGSWTASPKAYAHLYIDDAALGCPLLPCPVGGRPYVDWWAVEAYLKEIGIL